MRCGEDDDGNPYSRCGVYRDDFAELTQRLEALGAHSCDVTRRALQLDSPIDSTTGWYTKRYVESTIKGVLIPRSSSYIAAAAGTYVREDYLFFTADPLFFGDEIILESNYYEVKGSKPWRFADSFSHYECDLTELPLHHLSYSSTTPTVEDARSRTKTYWDTYISRSNLQRKSFIVCYSDPDYPLTRVFAGKHIQIIFGIDQGTAEPNMGVRYKEHVPTHVLTLDTQLQWLGEAELRRVVEDHPEGSMRTLDRVAKHDRWLGSTRLYDTEFMLNYTRTSALGMA